MGGGGRHWIVKRTERPNNQKDLIPLTSLANLFLIFCQMLPLDPEAVSITDEAANVDDNRSAYEPVQRNLVNLFPVFVEVERRVNVGARVSAEAEGVNIRLLSGIGWLV